MNSRSIYLSPVRVRKSDQSRPNLSSSVVTELCREILNQSHGVTIPRKPPGARKRRKKEAAPPVVEEGPVEETDDEQHGAVYVEVEERQTSYGTEPPRSQLMPSAHNPDQRYPPQPWQSNPLLYYAAMNYYASVLSLSQGEPQDPVFSRSPPGAAGSSVSMTSLDVVPTSPPALSLAETALSPREGLVSLAPPRSPRLLLHQSHHSTVEGPQLKEGKGCGLKKLAPRFLPEGHATLSLPQLSGSGTRFSPPRPQYEFTVPQPPSVEKGACSPPRAVQKMLFHASPKETLQPAVDGDKQPVSNFATSLSGPCPEPKTLTPLGMNLSAPPVERLDQWKPVVHAEPQGVPVQAPSLKEQTGMYYVPSTFIAPASYAATSSQQSGLGSDIAGQGRKVVRQSASALSKVDHPERVGLGSDRAGQGQKAVQQSASAPSRVDHPERVLSSNKSSAETGSQTMRTTSSTVERTPQKGSNPGTREAKQNPSLYTSSESRKDISSGTASPLTVRTTSSPVEKTARKNKNHGTQGKSPFLDSDFSPQLASQQKRDSECNVDLGVDSNFSSSFTSQKKRSSGPSQEPGGYISLGSRKSSKASPQRAIRKSTGSSASPRGRGCNLVSVRVQRIRVATSLSPGHTTRKSSKKKGASSEDLEPSFEVASPTQRNPGSSRPERSRRSVSRSPPSATKTAVCEESIKRDYNASLQGASQTLKTSTSSGLANKPEAPEVKKGRNSLSTQGTTEVASFNWSKASNVSVDLPPKRVSFDENVTRVRQVLAHVSPSDEDTDSSPAPSSLNSATPSPSKESLSSTSTSKTNIVAVAAAEESKEEGGAAQSDPVSHEATEERREEGEAAESDIDETAEESKEEGEDAQSNLSAADDFHAAAQAIILLERAKRDKKGTVVPFPSFLETYSMEGILEAVKNSGKSEYFDVLASLSDQQTKRTAEEGDEEEQPVEGNGKRTLSISVPSKEVIQQVLVNKLLEFGKTRGRALQVAEEKFLELKASKSDTFYVGQRARRRVQFSKQKQSGALLVQWARLLLKDPVMRIKTMPRLGKRLITKSNATQILGPALKQLVSSIPMRIRLYGICRYRMEQREKAASMLQCWTKTSLIGGLKGIILAFRHGLNKTKEERTVISAAMAKLRALETARKLGRRLSHKVRVQQQQKAIEALASDLENIENNKAPAVPVQRANKMRSAFTTNFKKNATTLRALSGMKKKAPPQKT